MWARHAPRSGRAPRAFLLALLIAPLAGAGSASNPDIQDPENDVQFSRGLLNVAPPEIDLRAVWVETGPASVSVFFRLADLDHRVHPGEDAHYTLTFNNEEYGFAIVSAMRLSGAWSYDFSATTRDGAPVSAAATGSVDLAADVIRVDVPRSAIASDMVDATAGTLLGISTPAGYQSGGTAWFRDWAPDDLDGPTIPVA